MHLALFIHQIEKIWRPQILIARTKSRAIIWYIMYLYTYTAVQCERPLADAGLTQRHADAFTISSQLHIRWMTSTNCQYSKSYVITEKKKSHWFP